MKSVTQRYSSLRTTTSLPKVNFSMASFFGCSELWNAGQFGSLHITLQRLPYAFRREFSATQFGQPMHYLEGYCGSPRLSSQSVDRPLRGHTIHRCYYSGRNLKALIMDSLMHYDTRYGTSNASTADHQPCTPRTDRTCRPREFAVGRVVCH